MAKRISTITFIFIIVTCLTQYFIGLEYSSLNDKLIEIYSLVISIYSMYAIYFSFIQFVIQLKSENIFFGINYVSEKIDELEEIKFSRKKYFFLLLLLLGVLPIFFTWNIIIKLVWISILAILIILFLIILYKVFNLIFEISDDDILKKQIFCYGKVIKNINKGFGEIYSNYKGNDEFNEEEKGIFLGRILIYHIIKYADSLKNKAEKIHVYNTILGKIELKNKLGLKSFYMSYFNIFLEKNIELIYVKETTEDGKKFRLSYPILDTFADLDRSDECFDIIKKIVLNNKDNIDQLLLLIFLFEIIHNYSFESMKELLDLINILSAKGSKKFDLDDPINSELLYRLFLKGDKRNRTKINDLEKENIKKIWHMLFCLDIDLLELPKNPSFSNIDLKKIQFDDNNIYEDAKNEFRKSKKV